MPVRTVSRNSVIPSEGRFFKELWGRPTTTADLRSSLWQMPHASHIFLLKIRFKIEVCTSSQFSYGRYALDQKEVELVDSVDELRSSSSVRGVSNANFLKYSMQGLLSALNKIIHNSHFKSRISLEEQEGLKQDRFLRGRQIAYLIYEYFRVIGANDSVENYADLFTIGLRNDDIREFDSKWDGIFIVYDESPTWWHLGRIVQIKNTRVWET